MGGDGVNLYQYCRGNPIGWWDPTGLQAAITGPGTSANPVGALAGGALIGLLLFTQTEVYQSAISAAASGVSLYAGRAFDAGELMFTYAESAVLSVSIALGSGAHSIRQGEALDDIKTKIPVIEEHLRKLAALGLAATGGPKGEPPRDPRNHWLEEIRAQLRYIENKLKNLKGKTYREWSQRLELWKKDFMDQGGKW